MGFLLFLVTIGVLFLAIIFLRYAFRRNIYWLKHFIFGSITAWLIFYTVALVGFSLKSETKVLDLGESKNFCGFYFECRSFIELKEVRKAENIGNYSAQGTFLIITVELFSAEGAPGRYTRLMKPKAELQAIEGGIYTRNLEVENELPTASVNLNEYIETKTELKKELVFDVPEDSNYLYLSITEDFAIYKAGETILIDDEDSLWHRPTVWRVNVREAKIVN